MFAYAANDTLQPVYKCSEIDRTGMNHGEKCEPTKREKEKDNDKKRREKHRELECEFSVINRNIIHCSSSASHSPM